MPAGDAWHVAQRWMRKAENDLRNVVIVLAAEDPPLDTVCFHAQQAAEKYLKALLTCHGIPFGRTHDLSLLVDRLPPDSGVPGAVGDLEEPSHAAVEARYPGPDDDIDRALAEHLVEQALCVRSAVTAELAAFSPAGREGWPGEPA